MKSRGVKDATCNWLIFRTEASLKYNHVTFVSNSFYMGGKRVAWKITVKFVATTNHVYG
jgi:hypothetical protein